MKNTNSNINTPIFQKIDGELPKLTSVGMGKINALVLEDDHAMKPIITHSLHRASPYIQVDWVDSAEEGLLKVSKNQYALIIADIFLKGEKSGLEFWNCCQKFCPETPILLTSGITIDTFLKYVGRDAICPPFLPKPFKIGQCKQIIEGLLSYSELSS